MPKQRKHYRYHIMYKGKFFMSARKKETALECKWLPIMDYGQYKYVKVIDTKTNKEIKEV